MPSAGARALGGPERAQQHTVATAALTSLGTTSPRYMRQTAMYLPWRGSHLVMSEVGSKTMLVHSATVFSSAAAFVAVAAHAYGLPQDDETVQQAAQMMAMRAEMTQYMTSG